MECDVYCRIVCHDKKQLEFIALMLSDDINKPMFEEDVEAPFRELYAVLEEVDEAEAVEAEKSTTALLGRWFFGDSLQAESLLKTLASLDVKGFYGVYFLDGQDPSLVVAQAPDQVTLNRWPEETYTAMCEPDSDPLDILSDIEGMLTQ